MDRVIKVKLPESLYNYMQSYILEKDESVDNIVYCALKTFFDLDAALERQREFMDV